MLDDGDFILKALMDWGGRECESKRGFPFLPGFR